MEIRDTHTKKTTTIDDEQPNQPKNDQHFDEQNKIKKLFHMEINVFEEN